MSLSQHRLLNLRPFGISWNLWRCEDPCLHNVFPFWAEPKTCTGLLSYHSPLPSVLGQHQTPTLNTACVFCHPGSNPRYWHCFVDEDAMSWTKSSLVFFFTWSDLDVCVVYIKPWASVCSSDIVKVPRHFSQSTPQLPDQLDHKMWPSSATGLHLYFKFGFKDIKC